MNQINESDSLKSFLVYLIKNKLVFIFLFILLSIVSLVYINNVNPKYLAQTYLEFEDGGNKSDFEGILPISIPSSSANVTKFDKAKHFLYSFNFFNELINNKEFLYQLISFDSFNNDNRSDSFLSSYDDTNFTLDEKTKWRLFEKFQNFIDISLNDNNIATFSVLHYSPNISKSWSATILNSLDVFIKEKEEEKIYSKIDFYKKQFSDNNISQLNDSLSSLLTEEIKKLAFISAGDNYLYSIMDDTSTPYLKSYPKRTQLAAGSAALIFLLLNSFFLILFIFRIDLTLKWRFIPIGFK